jgi:hypothetical protein
MVVSETDHVRFLPSSVLPEASRGVAEYWQVSVV